MGKIDGKKLLQDVKRKVKTKQEKEKNNMNTSNKKTIIVTVAVTLLTIAIIGSLLYVGFQFGVSYEKNINAKITNQAKDMAVTLKPNQQ